MRSQRHGGGESHEHGIDLAPMLDFVMNLLIFFIITAVFVKELGIQVQRHGGSVEVESTLGRGTAVRLHFRPPRQEADRSEG